MTSPIQDHQVDVSAAYSGVRAAPACDCRRFKSASPNEKGPENRTFSTW